MLKSEMDNKTLRQFGLTLGFGVVGLFGIILPLLAHHHFAAWPWWLALGPVVLALFRPAWLRVFYTPWMRLGHVLGWINTRIILGIFFFALITPIGVIMRLMGKDPMHRRYDKSVISYRKLSTIQPIDHMERPF
jgi:hypothetical protein